MKSDNADSDNPPAEDLAEKELLSIVFDPDVFPSETIRGDLGKDPVGILLGQDLPDKSVSLFCETQPFHGVVAGVDNVVTMIGLVEHPERRTIFAIGLRGGFLRSPRRKDENVLYTRSFQNPAENPFSFDVTFAAFLGLVVIVAVPVSDERGEPVVFIRYPVGLAAQ